MLNEFTTFGVAAESTYGTWPTAAKNLINVTDLRPTRTRSEQTPPVYTGDRRTFPQLILSQGGGLILPLDLQYKNALLFYEQLMGSAIGALKSVTGTDISATSGVITTVAGDFSVFELGDWIALSGSISPNVAEWYGPITAKTATTLTLASTTQLSNFSAGGSVTVKSQRVVDGTTQGSLSWEAKLTRLTNQFLYGEGFKTSQITWAWEQGNFATEEVTLTGKEWKHASATKATGADVAAKTTGYMSAVEPAKGGVGRIWIADGTAVAGAATTLIVSRWGIQWMSKLDEVRGLGSAGPSAIDEGGVDGSQVSARVRFDDTARTAVADLIEAHTTMQMAISVRDLQNNRMLFFQPAGKPSGDIEFGARGSTVYQPLTVVSNDPAKDTTSAYTSSGFGYQHAVFFAAA